MGSQKTGSGKFASSKLDHKCSDSRYFSAEQKRMIIDAYLKDHVPLVQLCKAYHVSRISIWRWITNFVDSRGSHNRETSQKDTTQPPISMPQKEVKPVESPEEELAAEKVKGQTMDLLCRLFGKSWQAYYQHRDTLSKQLLTEEMVVQFIREIRERDPGIGGAKLHAIYQSRFGCDYAYMVGRDKMERIIAKNSLNIRLPRRKPRTTDSSHGYPTYPNLVKSLIPTRKNQVWVTDITYIPIWLNEDEYVFCFLSMISDYFTKEIIGWNASCISELKIKTDLCWATVGQMDKKKRCKSRFTTYYTFTLVIRLGFEPRTPSLKGMCSTS